jgi:hypothetical protein
VCCEVEVFARVVVRNVMYHHVSSRNLKNVAALARIALLRHTNKKYTNVVFDIFSTLLMNDSIFINFASSHYGDNIVESVILRLCIAFFLLCRRLRNVTARHASEGRGFDSRWSHWNFSVT